MNKRVIICPKCQKENLLQANYCSFCNCELKELKEKEYEKSLAYKVDKAHKSIKKITSLPKVLKNPLSAITKKKKVKTALTVLLFIGGIIIMIINKPIWTGIIITSTDEYTVTYKSKCYEITTDNDNIDLMFASSKEVVEVHIIDEDGNPVLDATSDEKLTLEVDKDTGKYQLMTINTDKSKAIVYFMFK